MKTTHPIIKQHKIYIKDMVTTTLTEFLSTTELEKQSAIMATVKGPARWFTRTRANQSCKTK